VCSYHEFFFFWIMTATVNSELWYPHSAIYVVSRKTALALKCGNCNERALRDYTANLKVDNTQSIAERTEVMRRQYDSYYPRAPAAEALAPTLQMGSWRGTYVEDDCLDVGFVRHGV
jgi:hypothetical protein